MPLQDLAHFFLGWAKLSAGVELILFLNLLFWGAIAAFFVLQRLTK